MSVYLFKPLTVNSINLSILCFEISREVHFFSPGKVERKLTGETGTVRKSPAFKEAGIVYFNSLILKKATLSSVFSMRHDIGARGTDHNCKVTYGGRKLNDMIEVIGVV